MLALGCLLFGRGVRGLRDGTFIGLADCGPRYARSFSRDRHPGQPRL